MSNPYQDHFKKAKKSRATEPKQQHQTMVRKAKRTRFPMSALAVLSIITGAIGYGYSNLDQVEEQLGRLEFGLFGMAVGKEEKAKTPVGETAKVAGADGAGSKAVCPENTAVTSEEMSHFSKLADRKRELDLREQELNALEEELHKQRQEVESRIAKLEVIRGEIGTVLKERIDVDEERVARLVEFYSNMKPKQAAEIFNDLNEGLAVEVLGRMKKKNAAEIMNLLEAKKAQALSEKFAGYKRR